MLWRLSKILLPDLVNKTSTEFDHHLICRFAFSFKTTAVNVSFVSISACQHVIVVKSKTHVQQCKRKDLSKHFWCSLYSTKSSLFQLSFETQSWYTYISDCLFVCLVTEILEFIWVVVLAVKTKRYLHVSCMLLFDYPHIPNKT